MFNTLVVALADAEVDPTVHTGTGIDRAQILSLLIGFVIPALVALVTKHSDSPTMKVVVNLAANAANGFLTEWLVADNFVWQQALFGALVSFMMSMASFKGLWQPTGADARLKSSGRSDSGPGQRGYTTNRGLAIALIVIGIVVALLVSWILGIILIVVGVVLLFV